MDLIAGLKQGGKKKIGTNEACELELSFHCRAAFDPYFQIFHDS
jgi:hypothetical protein